MARFSLSFSEVSVACSRFYLISCSILGRGRRGRGGDVALTRSLLTVGPGMDNNFFRRNIRTISSWFGSTRNYVIKRNVLRTRKKRCALTWLLFSPLLGFYTLVLFQDSRISNLLIKLQQVSTLITENHISLVTAIFVSTVL